MVASLWLQPIGPAQAALRVLIAALAAENGTLPFEPHMTVCTIADATPAACAAVAAQLRRGGRLPLMVRRAALSTSTTAPTRAVVIDLENSPELRSFREALRRATGAGELAAPHISLLYAIDGREQRTEWSGSAARLQAIADAAAARLAASEFALADPILVAPEAGDWHKIKSWKTLQHF